MIHLGVSLLGESRTLQSHGKKVITFVQIAINVCEPWEPEKFYTNVFCRSSQNSLKDGRGWNH